MAANLELETDSGLVPAQGPDSPPPIGHKMEGKIGRAIHGAAVGVEGLFLPWSLLSQVLEPSILFCNWFKRPSCFSFLPPYH